MSSTEPTPVDVAIAALTAAARPVDPDTGTVREADMGEILCHVITSVAANLGGEDALLAGRPGSWEAALIRQVVESTAGDQLQSYRTVPVEVHVDPEDVFNNLGLWALHEAAVDVLNEREDVVDTDADGVVSDAGEAQLVAIDADRVAVETLWQSDLDTFMATFTAGAEAAAVAYGLSAPVVVVRVNIDAGPQIGDVLDEQLFEAGFHAAVLPSGLRVADYPSPSTPGEVDQANGLDYLARVEARRQS